MPCSFSIHKCLCLFIGKWRISHVGPLVQILPCKGQVYEHVARVTISGIFRQVANGSKGVREEINSFIINLISIN